MNPTISCKLGQHLSLAPQLQQAIRLLQLSAIELQEECQRLLESNPMLEVDESGNQSASEEQAPPDKVQTATSDTGREEEFAVTRAEEDNAQSQMQGTPEPVSQTSGKRGDSDDGFNLEGIVSKQQSLQDYLIWQMEMTPLTPVEVDVATYLIDSINEDGYLTDTLASLYEAFSLSNTAHRVDIDKMESVLKIIQSFDPLGVGARDLRECLLLQLDNLPCQTQGKDNAVRIVSQYMNLLAKCDYKQISKRAKLSSDDLNTAIDLIQAQNPRPGSCIGGIDVGYIVPDVVTFQDNGRWVVRLNQSVSSKLMLNQQYTSLIKRADNSRDNVFLKDNLKEARWFLKSLENRNQTLLKVATCIVDRQKDFLEHGEHRMKPMVLQDVAEAVDLHESTVSRITTQKYIHTPRGIFELKYFFSCEVNSGENESISATAIRAHIKVLVEGEDPLKPLSDLKIAEHLKEQHGINIARRTVTKYREALKILPSNERRYLVSSVNR